jgi:hypothetical protein
MTTIHLNLLDNSITRKPRGLITESESTPFPKAEEGLLLLLKNYISSKHNYNIIKNHYNTQEKDKIN